MKRQFAKPDALIPQEEAHRMLAVSTMTAWRRRRDDPTFPTRVMIGPRRYGYRLSDIERYVRARPTATKL